MEAYCVKCKARREMEQVRHETTKNGNPIIKGICTVCGHEINIVN